MAGGAQSALEEVAWIVWRKHLANLLSSSIVANLGIKWQSSRGFVTDLPWPTMTPTNEENAMKDWSAPAVATGNMMHFTRNSVNGSMLDTRHSKEWWTPSKGSRKTRVCRSPQPDFNFTKRFNRFWFLQTLPKHVDQHERSVDKKMLHRNEVDDCTSYQEDSDRIKRQTAPWKCSQ